MATGGSDHDIKEVAEMVRHATPQLKSAGKGTGALVGPVSWVLVTQLSHMLSGTRHQWCPGTILQQWTMNELLRRTTTPKFTVDTGSYKPMEHQITGACNIAATGRFYIMDEPGCGKTASILWGLKLREQLYGDALPAIVVAPASVVDVWKEEAALCWPGLPVQTWRGPERHAMGVLLRGLYVMSYAVMSNDVEGGRLKRLGANTVVYDEGHKLANHNTRQSQNGRKLAHQMKNVVLASGTPITKNTANLWPALQAMDGDSWPSRERFVGRYCETGFSAYGEDIEGLIKEREPEFRTALTGSYRRVAKADVLDLPPKTYQRRMVEIPTEWRAAYDEMAEDMLAHLPDNDEPLPAMSTVAQLMRLTQLASAAADVAVEKAWDEESQSFKDEVHVTLKEPSWKVDALMEIMKEHEGDPLVTFSPSSQLVRLAGQRAAREGYKVAYIVGGIPDKQRTATRKAFQNGELDLLCVTSGAGGLGLTLTRACTAVMLSRPWSYVEAVQSEDRLHRRGATRPVQIIDICAKNTVDRRIKARLLEKANAWSEFAKDPRLVKEWLTNGGDDDDSWQQFA
jgi:SNF2 family DNA or RNA helicase